MSNREELYRLLDRIPESGEERAAVAAALSYPSPDIPFEQIRRVQ